MTAVYYGCQPMDSIPCVYGPAPSRPWHEPSPANKPLIEPGTQFFPPIDIGSPPAPKGMSKGESLAVACFVSGLHEKDPMKAAAALLQLIDYIRELESKVPL